MHKYILNTVQLTSKLQMRVMRHASRNFEDNLRVGLVRHKNYATQERLLMS